VAVVVAAITELLKQVAAVAELVVLEGHFLEEQEYLVKAMLAVLTDLV
jgi:hypothetical protein